MKGIMKRVFMNQRLLVLIFLVLAGITFVAWDVHTPYKVNWASASLKGRDVMQASGLILQHQVADEVWATKGYSIYLSQGGKHFEKITTIRPRFGLAWLGYSHTLRSWTKHLELTEVIPLSSEHLVVFAGGDIYRLQRSTKAQQHVHRLRYFGLGQGRGVLPHGIVVDADGSIYYGEYTTLPKNNHTVRLYRSNDQGKTWKVAFEFKPGEARHIHTLRWDPIANAIWIGTGDRDPQSRIGYSRDGGRHFRWIGQNSQLFRVVSLIFFDHNVVWATDTQAAESQRAVSWNRHENRVAVGTQPLPAAAYYALKLNDQSGIITLAERELSVWKIDDQHRVERLFEWPVAKIKRRGPNPAIRLPRGSAVDSRWTYLNPLRTSMADALIYRVPTSMLSKKHADQHQTSKDMAQH